MLLSYDTFITKITRACAFNGTNESRVFIRSVLDILDFIISRTYTRSDQKIVDFRKKYIKLAILIE